MPGHPLQLLPPFLRVFARAFDRQFPPRNPYPSRPAAPAQFPWELRRKSTTIHTTDGFQDRTIHPTPFVPPLLVPRVSVASGPSALLNDGGVKIGPIL
jgi:hypothetical protein